MVSSCLKAQDETEPDEFHIFVDGSCLPSLDDQMGYGLIVIAYRKHLSNTLLTLYKIRLHEFLTTTLTSTSTTTTL